MSPSKLRIIHSRAHLSGPGRKVSCFQNLPLPSFPPLHISPTSRASLTSHTYSDLCFTPNCFLESNSSYCYCIVYTLSAEVSALEMLFHSVFANGPWGNYFRLILKSFREVERHSLGADPAPTLRSIECKSHESFYSTNAASVILLLFAGIFLFNIICDDRMGMHHLEGTRAQMSRWRWSELSGHGSLPRSCYWHLPRFRKVRLTDKCLRETEMTSLSK